MWRKNRRDNLDGTYGVDLNRNYGFNWGFDNVGSSNLTSSDTYRGTAGFSEPETQAVKWFIEQHNFQFNLNYHTYSNDLIYPWGYIGSFKTPDSLLFDAYGAFLTKENKYRFGTCDQMLNYITNGGSDDWGYGEQITKNKVFSFTPEVGPAVSGFYPPASDIEGLCADNLFPNIHAADLLLQYASVKSTGNLLVSQLTNSFHLAIQRLGLANGGTFTATIQPLDAWVVATGQTVVVTNLNLLQIHADSISYTLASTITSGQFFRLLLTINNGFFDESDTITLQYVNPTTQLPLTAADWNMNSGTWGICNTTFFSAPDCLADSPVGNYQDNTFSSMQLKQKVNLTNATNPAFTFYTKWMLEAQADYVVVEASANNGLSWTALCGNYTHAGNLNQLLGEPIFDGDNHATQWVKERMPLDQFVNQSILLRVTLASDVSINYDGFFMDDMAIEGIDTSHHGTIGITKLNEQVEPQLFPNPGVESFSIKNLAAGKISVSISSMAGQLILPKTTYTINHENDQLTIPCVNLSKGIYLVELTTATSQQKWKWIKME
jgi:hypothetical protein